MWWKSTVVLGLVIKNRNFFHVKVSSGLGPVSGYITMVYGPPTERERREWWPQLIRLGLGEEVPWLCYGDFNELLSNAEKAGGRYRENEAHVMEQLDRALCNTAWREACPRAQVCTLEPLGSDHTPLLIQPTYFGFYGSQEFKFELMWTDHVDYHRMIDREWGKVSGGEFGGNQDLLVCLDR